MIIFRPRNVNCWRYGNDNELMFENITFHSIEALKTFIERHFYYSKEHRPIFEISDNAVVYGLVVGYIELDKL